MLGNMTVRSRRVNINAESVLPEVCKHVVAFMLSHKDRRRTDVGYVL
jgi:hypothetical protein